MNNIIKKVLAELAKEQPRLDYVRGALETLLEMQEPQQSIASVFPPRPKTAFPAAGVVGREEDKPKDEGEILDALARARVESVKALAEKSTEIA